MNIKISITVCFLVTGEEKHPVSEHMMLYNLWHKFSRQTSEHSLYTDSDHDLPVTDEAMLHELQGKDGTS